MVSSVSSDTVDAHEILTNLLVVLFESCIVVMLSIAGLRVPLGIPTNEGSEELSSALVL